MLNFEGRRQEKAGRLFRKIEALERSISEFEDAISRDEALLNMYENPLWEKFVKSILMPEKSRLAERRMAIPIENEADHLLITGQFLEANTLSASRDELIQTIDDNLTGLETARAKLESARSELSRTET